MKNLTKINLSGMTNAMSDIELKCVVGGVTADGCGCSDDDPGCVCCS